MGHVHIAGGFVDHLPDPKMILQYLLLMLFVPVATFTLAYAVARLTGKVTFLDAAWGVGYVLIALGELFCFFDQRSAQFALVAGGQPVGFAARVVRCGTDCENRRR